MRNSKKELLAFFLAILVIVSSHQGPTHQCIHDEIMKNFQPDYLTEQDYAQRLNTDAQGRISEHRILQSTRDTNTVNPIRITWDSSQITGFTAAQKSFCQSVTRAVVVFFSRVLKVFPITGNNIWASNQTCQTSTTDAFVVPAADQATANGGTGVGVPNSDLHIYLSSIDAGSGTLAWATACVVTTRGPVFGRINFNPQMITATTTDLNNNDTVEYWTEVTIHEMMHVLGLSGSAIANWVDPATGTFHTAASAALLTSTITLDNLSGTLLKSPNVVAYTQDYFNCPSATGLPFENEGGSGSLGSHFQRVVLGNECMTASATNSDCYFTPFSLQILRDTNYYAKVEENVFESGVFGKGQGCSFLNSSCSVKAAAGSGFAEFCQATPANPNDNVCGFFAFGGGYCSGNDNFANGGSCQTMTEYSNTDCQDPLSHATTLNCNESFGNVESRCFVSNLLSTSYSSYGRAYRCFKWTCNADGTSLSVVIGTQSFACSGPGATITPGIAGYTGTVTCPNDIRRFCDFSGHCPNKCSKNGFCMQGMCYCNPGFGGIDCSVACTTVVSGGACVQSCPSGTVAGPDYNCVSTAPIGFVIQDSAMLRCNKNCRSCSGPSPSQCLSCPSNKYLENTSCVNTCSAGYTLNTTTFKCTSTCSACNAGFYIGANCVCTACSSTCLTCNNANSCLTCPAGKALLADGTCGCQFNCLTCSGPLDSNCASCASGKFLSGTSCVNTCPSGTTANTTTNTCTSGNVACHSSCLTCQAGNSTTCTTCPTGKVLLANGTCGCDASCATCDGVAATNCLSCTVSTNKLFNKTCVATCPAGYFGVSSNNTCTACEATCLNCSGALATNCTSCPQGRFLSGTSCVTTCPAGFYGLASNNTCAACEATCLTCNGALATNCVSCASGRFLSSNSCLNNCPAGTTANTTTNTCTTSTVACHSSCLTCQAGNSTTCTTCPTGKVLLANGTCGCEASCATCDGTAATNCLSCAVSTNKLFNKSCIATCPAGYFGVSTNNTCTACEATCLTCSGSLATNCVSCASGRFLSGTSCVTTCPTGTTANTTTKTCNTSTGSCHSSCLTCQAGNTTTCSTCPTGRVILANGTCGCDASCATCDGVAATNCLTCSVSTNKLLNKSCIATCPAGFFGVSTSNTCTACNTSCLNCNGALATNCTSCASGRFLSGTSCVTSCPTGTTANTTTNTCTTTTVACHPSCLTCAAGNTTACTTCPTTKILLNGLCACPVQTFEDTTTKTCQACATNCNSCVNATTCESCLAYTYKNASQQCVSDCGTGFFGLGGDCWACSASCKTCKSVTNCTSCQTGYFYLSSNTSCSTTCPTGYQANSTTNNCDLNTVTCPAGQFLSNNVCTACTASLSCLTCANSTSCLTCQTGFVVLDTGKCGCGTNCATCNGQTANNCLTCVGSTFKSVSSTGTQCLSACLAGFFADTTNKTCNACTSPCATCTSSTVCVSCVTGYSLTTNKTCAPSNCPVGQYINGTVCSACNSLCATCTNATTCATCPAGKVKLSTNLCGCDASCAQCNGTTSTNCTTCTAPRLLLNNSCVTACPTNYTSVSGTCQLNDGFFINSSGVVTACDAQCQTCVSTAINCLTCKDTTLVASSTGTCTCSAGKFMTATGVCSPCGANCSVCTSATACTTCLNTTFTLTSGSCTCPSPKTISNGSCISNITCHFQCSTCTSSLQTGCTGCNYSPYLGLSAGQCNANPGYFFFCKDTVTQSTLNGITTTTTTTNCSYGTCNTKCSTCNTSSTDCTTCKTGFTQQTNGTCLRRNLLGQFLEEDFQSDQYQDTQVIQLDSVVDVQISQGIQEPVSELVYESASESASIINFAIFVLMTILLI